MNIRSTGLSLLISALFAIPAATATAVSPVAGTAAHQGETGYLILAEAHQHQGSEGTEQRYASDSGHAGHEQGCQGHSGGSGGYSSGHGGKDQHGHHGYAHSIVMQAEALGLSDEQLGKIVRLHLKEDTQAHERIKQKMMESMKAFRKAVGEPATDDETLRKLGQAHIDSFNEMVKYHLEERKAVRSILTPEQLGKLKSVKSGHDH